MTASHGKIAGINGNMLTVEFDGQNFVQTPMSEGIELREGNMGFYPETGQIIFFGTNRDTDPSFGTFAYDGNTWTQLATQAHPTVYATYSGMIYDPDLHGLVAVRNDLYFFDAWLFRDKDWHPIATQESPSPRIYPAMTYSPALATLLLTGGSNYSPVPFDTWKLRRVIHSKPVSKPKH